MHSVHIAFLIVLSVPANVLCLTKVFCDLNDEACLTKAAQRMYPEVVDGLPDIGLKSSDPLPDDLIAVKLPTLNYTLHDTYLYGLKNCRVTELKMDWKDVSSVFMITCPRLVLEGNYYNNGYIYSQYIEGKGKFKIVYDDYRIGLHGHFNTFISTDGVTHLSYSSFTLNPLEVDGGVVYKFDNLFYGNEEKSAACHKYLNDNWKKISDTTQPPLMNSLMGKLVENTNKYLGSVSIDNLFYIYE